MALNVETRAAFAIGELLRRKFVQQFIMQVPVLAVLQPVLKGSGALGTQMELPLVYLGPQGMELDSIGVEDANEIPSAWPVYPETRGFTHAVYQWTHWEHTMTIKSSEKRLLSDKSRTQSVLSAKIAQMQAKFVEIMDANICGNYADSRTRLMGIPYMVSASNTVGGIPQASNSWWQSDVSTMSTTSLATVSALADRLQDKSSVNPQTMRKSRPDLLLLSAPEGGFDVYGQMRQLIQPAERVVNNEANLMKYGINMYEYAGLKCIRGNRLPAGTAYMLQTENLYFRGDDTLTALSTERIPGSSAHETQYEWWGGIGTDSCRSFGAFTGITA